MSFGILGSAAAAAAAAAAASAAVASSASSGPKHTCGCEACMRMTGADEISATSYCDGGESVMIQWHYGAEDPDATKELRELLLMLCGIKNAIKKCRAENPYGIDWRELLPPRFRELYLDIEESEGGEDDL